MSAALAPAGLPAAPDRSDPTAVDDRTADVDLPGEQGPAGRVALRDTLPLALALVPFGVALGGSSAAAGLGPLESAFGAVVLLAGAAQLAAVEAIGAGDGILAVAVVVTMINLRFVVYGAGVASWFADLPLRLRALLAFPVVDQTFLLCQRRFGPRTGTRWRVRYYTTATTMLAGAFVGSQVVAFQLGARLPAGLGLHLAAPLVFAGLLARSLEAGQARVAAACAPVLVVAATPAIGVVALPLGVGAGVALAVGTGRRR